MLQSQLFTKTRREGPRDESAKNADLLVRAGYVDKLSAGVYSYLPLGLLVLNKIRQIIKEEIDLIGGQEILMPTLQPKENWMKTGRWDSMDNLYKVTDNEGREIALGPTHEEIVVPLLQHFVSSYRDLPTCVYQFQTKFRMEARSKSGLLRGREFMMKDAYSFHESEEDLKEYYEKARQAYKNIFDRVGIGHLTYLTYASGGQFSKFSHEFQTVTLSGEDTIYVCESCDQAINKEIFEAGQKCPACKSDAGAYREEKAIEVGNIFELKTKFTDAFSMTFKDKGGKDVPVTMGCYGIGLGRLMGAIVEVLSDEKGLVWPDAVAPFDVHLIGLNEKAREVYSKLTEDGHTVLFDDRDVSAGEKFADADLLGIPKRLVISEKTVASKEMEWKDRKTGEVTYEKAII